MLEFSWYLLEASLVLSVLYALYALLLRGETFFGFNRFFLLAIVMISLLAPLLSWDFVPEKEVVVRRPIEQVQNMRQGYFEAMGDWYFEAASSEQGSERQVQVPWTHQWNWKAISVHFFFSIYLLGVMMVWSRLGWMLYGLFALRQKFPSRSINNVRIVELPDRSAPFSFLRTVFVNRDLVGSDAFHQILAHEQVHIRQRHSIDLIIVQILAAGLWFHPLIWRLLKSLKTTHEYIADKQMISSGHSLVEYQYLLLSQLISNQSYGLVHNFNLSFIKKRITMMKIKQSGWGGRAKVTITLSLAVLIDITLMQCNSKLEESTEIVEVPLEVGSSDFTQGVNLPVVYRERVYNSDHISERHLITLDVSIFSNQVTVNGENMSIDDFQLLTPANEFTSKEIVTLRVDANQSMGLVRRVQDELRRLNRRKVLYIGQSASGEVIELAILLPPLPDAPAEHGPKLPVLDDAYIAEHDLHVKKVNLGQSLSETLQTEIYDFVMSEVDQSRSKYVVSADFDDDDTYQTYLANLIFVMDGFNRVYQERSQAMFGRDFMRYDTSIEEDKRQYDIVRKGIPRAISISGKGC